MNFKNETDMTPITLNMNDILEEEAWFRISTKNISLSMLEKYADKFNWHVISWNSSIDWTIDALQKFADKLDWKEFSRHCPPHCVSDSFLQQFCDRWNWVELSQHNIFNNRVVNDIKKGWRWTIHRHCISKNSVDNDIDKSLLEKFLDLLEKFADKVDWSGLIHEGCIFQTPQAFFERFRQYIPIDGLQDTALWDRMVAERAEALWQEIGGGKMEAF